MSNQLNITDRLQQQVEASIPQDWRLPDVIRDISSGVRPYLAQVVPGGLTIDIAARIAIDAADLPDISDVDVASTIADLYAPDNVLRRMRSHADQLLAPDDPRWEIFREQAQINRGLDNFKLPREKQDELRARRTVLWAQLHDTFTADDYARAVPYPEIYAQCPALRQIGEEIWTAKQKYFRAGGVADSGKPEYRELSTRLAALVQSLPSDIREKITKMTRRNTWEHTRSKVGLKVRTALAAALPPVGQREREEREEGDQSNPSRRGAGAHFWRTLPTHYHKLVGDRSPGLE
jgi:hypothetical protein